MKQEMFAIKDLKAECFFPPLVAVNEQVAIRIFANCVNDPGHQFGKNPEDFVLFKIGSYDDLDMKMELEPKPVPMHRGDEIPRWEEKQK